MIDALLFSIPPELDGERVDRAVSQLVEGLSRSAVQRLIEEGNLIKNRQPVSKNDRVKAGDSVRVTMGSRVQSRLSRRKSHWISAMRMTTFW